MDRRKQARLILLTVIFLTTALFLGLIWVGQYRHHG